MLLMKAEIEHGYRSFRSICIRDDSGDKTSLLALCDTASKDIERIRTGSQNEHPRAGHKQRQARYVKHTSALSRAQAAYNDNYSRAETGWEEVY